MKRPFPYLFLFCVVLVLAALHLGGTYFYLYWRIPGFDRVAHTVGGFFAASAIISAVAYGTRLRTAKIFLLGILAALAVGVAWEIFELQSGVTDITYGGYWPDTIKDILFDCAGGLAAVAYSFKIYSSS